MAQPNHPDNTIDESIPPGNTNVSLPSIRQILATTAQPNHPDNTVDESIPPGNIDVSLPSIRQVWGTMGQTYHPDNTIDESTPPGNVNLSLPSLTQVLVSSQLSPRRYDAETNSGPMGFAFAHEFNIPWSPDIFEPANWKVSVTYLLNEDYSEEYRQPRGRDNQPYVWRYQDKREVFELNKHCFVLLEPSGKIEVERHLPELDYLALRPPRRSEWAHLVVVVPGGADAPSLPTFLHEEDQKTGVYFHCKVNMIYHGPKGLGLTPRHFTIPLKPSIRPNIPSGTGDNAPSAEEATSVAKTCFKVVSPDSEHAPKDRSRDKTSKFTPAQVDCVLYSSFHGMCLY